MRCNIMKFTDFSVGVAFEYLIHSKKNSFSWLDLVTALRYNVIGTSLYE